MTWELDPSNVDTGLPLEGVRVLDLSRVLAGPLCAMVAGDLGADVIKVESPQGDPVRAFSPPEFGGDATYYLAVNRHRRNVVADLRDPRDVARIGDLIEQADAVVENYLPSQYVALEIAELRARNPECVWVSITPASRGGSLADQPSFDLLAQARSGLMGVTGEPGDVPSKVGAPVADVITGLYGVIGLLSGLVAKGRGGAARHFEAPLLESTMSALINQAQGYLSTGLNPQRLGNDHPSITPYGPVATADGHLLLAVGTDAQFARLVDLLDDAGLRERREWATNESRIEGRGELRRELDRVFGEHSTREWLGRLEDSGVPFSPILDVAGAFEQDQIRSGDFVGTMSSAGGPTRSMKTPLIIDGVRPSIRRGPRGLDEDSEDVFGDSSTSEEDLP